MQVLFTNIYIFSQNKFNELSTISLLKPLVKIEVRTLCFIPQDLLSLNGQFHLYEKNLLL